MGQTGIENVVTCEASPERAIVIPRGRRPDDSSRVPIDRLVLPRLRQHLSGLIIITAPPGGGKTTALNYLRANLTEFPHVRYFDADQIQQTHEAALNAPVILICGPVLRPKFELAAFELCPWTIDDCMEYLLARHREQTGSVLTRLRNDPSLDQLLGSPELLSLVMDRMAANASLSSSRAVLGQIVSGFDESADMIEARVNFAADRLRIRPAAGTMAKAKELLAARDELRWLRHEAIQRIVLSRWIASELGGGAVPACLWDMAAKPLLHDIALELAAEGAANTSAKQRLEALIADAPACAAVPMAASILLRVDANWRPQSKGPLNLAGAVLCSAKWAGINLRSAYLGKADLSAADLSGANLTKANIARARMNGACLRSAQLKKAVLSFAKLAGADLSHARITGAEIISTDLTGANLIEADLSKCDMENVCLADANLTWVVLRGASLDQCDLANAHFDDADFAGARLTCLKMQSATWDRVSFRRAHLYHCNLEELTIKAADFSCADLTGSLLTGSRVLRAKFDHANLSNTGLADIDWTAADLRDADFTYASFHLGSSRSGLVGSTIPREGSRTGFYTDDFHEQYFKSPQEIRKACLFNANLRGALVSDTDFYLVDLRCAQYTPPQREHFARCGAILESRSAAE